jgi:hypothetical protein
MTFSCPYGELHNVPCNCPFPFVHFRQKEAWTVSCLLNFFAFPFPDLDTTLSVFLEIRFVMCSTAIPGLLLIVSNFADGSSSESFERMALPLGICQPFMRDTIALAAFAIHMSLFEYQGAGLKSVVLWFLLAISTTFFPSLVTAIAHVTQGMPIPKSNQLLSHARLVGPMLFGLRYGLLTELFEFPYCLDAVFLMLLTRSRIQRLTQDLVLPELFLEGCPMYAVHGFLGAQAAYSVLQIQAGRITLVEELFELCVPFLLLIVLNFFFHKLFTMGVALGSIIGQQAGPVVGTRPRRDHSALGVTCFGVWMCLLVAVVVSSC